MAKVPSLEELERKMFEALKRGDIKKELVQAHYQSILRGEEIPENEGEVTTELIKAFLEHMKSEDPRIALRAAMNIKLLVDIAREGEQSFQDIESIQREHEERAGIIETLMSQHQKANILKSFLKRARVVLELADRSKIPSKVLPEKLVRVFRTAKEGIRAAEESPGISTLRDKGRLFGELANHELVRRHLKNLEEI